MSAHAMAGRDSEQEVGDVRETGLLRRERVPTGLFEAAGVQGRLDEVEKGARRLMDVRREGTGPSTPAALITRCCRAARPAV
ncbi:hypothetical protein [Streptomyces sp. NPDC051921]|uniref:hypothetical protein n=1 Tax=Streptomyces sp. NPDC051921 TaxID=3155806 RepID=UPI003429006C